MKVQGWGVTLWRCKAHECKFDGCGSSVTDGEIKSATIYLKDEEGLNLRLTMNPEEAKRVYTQLRRIVEGGA